MANRRIQCLLAAKHKGFTLVEDPSGVQNRCFYQCLGKALRLETNEVVDMIEDYLMMNQVVENIDEVPF